LRFALGVNGFAMMVTPQIVGRAQYAPIDARSLSLAPSLVVSAIRYLRGQDRRGAPWQWALSVRQFERLVD
jgi:hypothetical protein